MKLDSSSKAIVLGNILTIILALLLRYDLAILIWVYWFESTLMGVFAFLKLLVGRTRQPRLLPMSTLLALFFAVHYGMFHLAYFVALSALPWFLVDPSEISWMLLAGGILTASHAFSFYENVIRRKERIPAGAGAAKLQFSEPYSRILPIHMTIIMSGFAIVFFGIGRNVGLLLLFMGFKTVSDLYFHRRKHGPG